MRPSLLSRPLTAPHRKRPVYISLQICYNKHKLYAERERVIVFKRRTAPGSYDRERLTPAIRCSICTGEQVAGFRDRRTGGFEEVMAIRNLRDLDEFRRAYGITEQIEKFY